MVEELKVVSVKAVVYNKYGPPEVLELRDVPKPSPKANEMLIKVYATSVTAGDWRMRKAEPFLVRIFSGLFKPGKVKILGFELSGVVEDLGADVRRFKRGDEVFAWCGFKFGAYAEYRCLPENENIELKPLNMSFEEAATVPLGAMTAIQFLRQAGIKSGDQVLIYGASGSVGTFAVQLAKYFGATVTGACSGKNIELVKSLGADRVIDYTQGELSKLDMKFDVIFEAVGKVSKSRLKGLLKPSGKFVSVMTNPKRQKDDLITIKQIIEKGQLRAVIDRTYSLDRIREAHAYVEQFHKRGNVAISVFGSHS